MSASWTDPLSAWPMWSTPVTFGGGTAIEKFSSGVPPGSGWCRPEAIRRSTVRGSPSAGSKRVRSARVLIEGRSLGRCDGADRRSGASVRAAQAAAERHELAGEPVGVDVARDATELAALVVREVHGVALRPAGERGQPRALVARQRPPAPVEHHRGLEDEQPRDLAADHLEHAVGLPGSGPGQSHGAAPLRPTRPGARSPPRARPRSRAWA